MFRVLGFLSFSNVGLDDAHVSKLDDFAGVSVSILCNT